MYVFSFRRKRGEREVTETPGDVIVRKLTIERIEELKRIIQEEAVKYRYGFRRLGVIGKNSSKRICCLCSHLN
jgi:hypothetical protein